MRDKIVSEKRFQTQFEQTYVQYMLYIHMFKIFFLILNNGDNNKREILQLLKI